MKKTYKNVEYELHIVSPVDIITESDDVVSDEFDET